LDVGVRELAVERGDHGLGGTPLGEGRACRGSGVLDCLGELGLRGDGPVGEVGDVRCQVCDEGPGGAEVAGEAGDGDEVVGALRAQGCGREGVGFGAPYGHGYGRVALDGEGIDLEGGLVDFLADVTKHGAEDGA
jgi:hypothetical protein